MYMMSVYLQADSMLVYMMCVCMCVCVCLQADFFLVYMMCVCLQADFVLVCLSPLYLEEVKGLDNAATPLAPKVTKAPATSSKWSKGALHSAYIYQLMREEYQNMGRCSRFVPLYMEGSPCDAGPSWLTSHLSYQWPRQYKDLLWMLTKPEDRIKQKSKLSPQKGHNALKTNGLRGGHLVSSPFT